MTEKNATYLCYSYEIHFQIRIPKDAPKDMSPLELYEWLQANNPSAFDTEVETGQGDLLTVDFSD